MWMDSVGLTNGSRLLRVVPRYPEFLMKYMVPPNASRVLSCARERRPRLSC